MICSSANKPTLGFFELESCHGCEQQILNADEKLFDVFNQVNVVYWPKLSDRKPPAAVDIAVVEGAVKTPEQEEFVKQLRENSKVIVAIGACACGLNKDALGESVHYRALTDFIDVDYCCRCCPIDTNQFLNVLQKAIGGRNTFESSACLCGECKSNEIGCFYGQGRLCAGLVSLCGCDGLCTRLNKQCRGCSGISKHACLETAFYNAENVTNVDGNDAFVSFLDVCSIDRFLEKNVEGLTGDDALFVEARFDGEISQELALNSASKFEKKNNLTIDSRDLILREILRLAERAHNDITSLVLSEFPQIKGYVDFQEFVEADSDFLKKCLELRHALTNILSEISGRAVHPITVEVGGFSKAVSDVALKRMSEEIDSELDFAVSLIDECSSNWEKSILGEQGTTVLKRVLENWDDLTDKARFGAAKAGLRPPETDSRKECIARAVEIVDSLQRITDFCRDLL